MDNDKPTLEEHVIAASMGGTLGEIDRPDPESKEATCECPQHVFSNEATMRIHALDFALKKKDTTIFERENTPTAENVVGDAKAFYKFLTGK